MPNTEIKIAKTSYGWTVECGAWFKSCKTKKSAEGMAHVFRSWLNAGTSPVTSL